MQQQIPTSYVKLDEELVKLKETQPVIEWHIFKQFAHLHGLNKYTLLTGKYP
jgi:hypothetical protein